MTLAIHGQFAGTLWSMGLVTHSLPKVGSVGYGRREVN